MKRDELRSEPQIRTCRLDLNLFIDEWPHDQSSHTKARTDLLSGENHTSTLDIAPSLLLDTDCPFHI
jgi:hypothetical protein